MYLHMYMYLQVCTCTCISNGVFVPVHVLYISMWIIMCIVLCIAAANDVILFSVSVRSVNGCFQCLASDAWMFVCSVLTMDVCPVMDVFVFMNALTVYVCAYIVCKWVNVWPMTLLYINRACMTGVCIAVEIISYSTCVHVLFILVCVLKPISL